MAKLIPSGSTVGPRGSGDPGRRFLIVGMASLRRSERGKYPGVHVANLAPSRNRPARGRNPPRVPVLPIFDDRVGGSREKAGVGDRPMRRSSGRNGLGEGRVIRYERGLGVAPPAP